MFRLYFFFTATLFCLSVPSLAASSVIPCQINDESCILQSANNLWQHLVVGDAAQGMEPLDPSHHQLIEGNLSILKYRFYNTTITGLRYCKINNVKVSSEISTVHLQLECPSITLRGTYDVTGRLIILPVEGQGDYSIITGLYRVDIDSDIKKSQNREGNTILHIKNYRLKSEALAPIKFDFKNLFNGQKDLSDAVHNFAHQSWKEVADLVQDPVWYASFKKVITNANLYLRSTPLKSMTLN